MFINRILSNIKTIVLVSSFLTINLFAQLPPIHINYSSYILSADNKVLGYIGDKNRVEVKSTGYISKYLIYSLIATEDRDFYNHDGVSMKGLARAAIQTITGHTQGGSTLTMQLTRNLFLTKEKTISRKLTEIEMARELEKRFSKDQLLLMYLNTVYFGRGAYGVWAAAQEFFQKMPGDLSITESAMIAGLVQSPTGYDPSKHPDKALKRRNEVLHNLVEVGKISEKEFDRLKGKPLGLKLRDHWATAFIEYVKREANDVLRKQGKSINTEHLRILTTLNSDAQRAAEAAIKSQWKELPKGMQSAQIGLISVEPGTGKILAMVGGNPSSNTAGLNRAVYIKRQPGSSFKPFLYGSLIERGYSLATPLLDSEIVFNKNSLFEWRPSNDNEVFSHTRMPMYEAIKHSVNAAAAYAVKNLTTPDSVCVFAKRCGISSYLKPLPSIILGTSDVSPMEMASAYAVFASSGYYSKPFGLLKIEDGDYRTLYYANVVSNCAVDSATCYIVDHALKSVIDGGTASSIKKYYSAPAAGKTGTTQNFTDAWFVGYTPFASTAIWVGFDNPKNKLTGAYKYGGTISAPIWGKMMGAAYKKWVKGKGGLVMPSNVKYVELCSESGKVAGPKCRQHVSYPINEGYLTDVCDIHK
jgi:penicillin-binding protein 2D